MSIENLKSLIQGIRKSGESLKASVATVLIAFAEHGAAHGDVSQTLPLLDAVEYGYSRGGKAMRAQAWRVLRDHTPVRITKKGDKLTVALESGWKPEDFKVDALKADGFDWTTYGDGPKAKAKPVTDVDFWLGVERYLLAKLDPESNLTEAARAEAKSLLEATAKKVAEAKVLKKAQRITLKAA